MCQKEDCNLVEGGVSFDNGFKRNIFIPVNGIDNFRMQYNNRGVYTTAYYYSNKEIDKAELYGDFYLDFDDNDLTQAYKAEEVFDRIREDALRSLAMLDALFHVSPGEVEIYFSGKKGLHLIIPAGTLGITPNAKLNEIYKLLAMDCKKYSKHNTIDTQIYDRKRLLRLPGSQHNDTNLYKIPLSYEQLLQLNFAEITLMAKEQLPIIHLPGKHNAKATRMFGELIKRWESSKLVRREDRGTESLNFTPPCERYLLYNNAPQGQRNNTVAVLVSYFKQRGKNQDEIIARLGRWNDRFCFPKLPVRELESTIKSIYVGTAHYGCSTLQQLSKCNPDRCLIGKGRMDNGVTITRS